jgi:8-oxo-dGTP diphosphatase
LGHDGRGVSFPGGLQRLRETPEQALVREVREETGLTVTEFTLKHRYHSSADVPVNIAVFEMEASGILQKSWEGVPRWLPLADVRRNILESQRPALELFE